MQTKGPTMPKLTDKIIGKFKDEMFGELSARQQEAIIANTKSKHESQINQLRYHAKYMEELIEKYHGQPLVEVMRKQPPEVIVTGDRRLSGRGEVLVCLGVQRGLVHYNTDKGRRTIGTRSWRALKKA